MSMSTVKTREVGCGVECRCRQGISHVCAAANERSLAAFGVGGWLNLITHLTVPTKYFPCLNLSTDGFVHSFGIIRDFNTAKRCMSSLSVEKPNENDR